MSWVRFNKINKPSNPAAGKVALFAANSGQIAGAGTTPAALAGLDESGNVCRLGGLATQDYRLIKVTSVTTTGASTYTPTAGAQALFVECIGGGGQGGGAATSSSTLSIGGGGGGGAYSAKWITGASIKTSYSVSVGVGGSGGAAGATGGNGGDTTFDSPSIVTAKGGTGGSVLAAGTTVVEQAGGAGGASGSGVGDIIFDGCPGGTGFRGSGTLGLSGTGGDGFVTGANAGARVAVTGGAAGNNAAAKAYGAGGSGAATTTTQQAGGTGAQGIIIVWEFA